MGVGGRWLVVGGRCLLVGGWWLVVGGRRLQVRIEEGNESVPALIKQAKSTANASAFAECGRRAREAATCEYEHRGGSDHPVPREEVAKGPKRVRLSRTATAT